ncbi:hypothetical protein Pelo_9691 [Pelomyxa schiedti]|nr:hypothetical protein Pelo_9691 [Pelomyxa schiedti]
MAALKTLATFATPKTCCDDSIIEHVRHCVHAAYWIREITSGSCESQEPPALDLTRPHFSLLTECDPKITIRQGLISFRGWPLDTTLSTHKELLWKSTIAAMVQGNTHDLNEVSLWVRTQTTSDLGGTYMRGATGTRSTRKIHVHGNQVTIEEGFNWVDGGTITTNNSTIYHNGWLLDQCVSSHKLLLSVVKIKGERGCKLVALSYKAGKAPSIIIIMRVRHTNKDNGTWVPPREELPALDVEPDVAAARDDPLLPDLLDVDQHAERGREQPCGRRRGRDCGGGPACQCNEL